MQIRCRNCGAAREIPKYHGSMLITCPDCEWQEMLPPRRHIPEELDHGAGVAFEARAKHRAAVLEELQRVAAFSPRRFDEFCASMYTARGYEVVFADRMLDESHALELRTGNELAFVACTPGAHRVTIEDLERLAGSKRHGSAARAIWVTTGDFDEAARAFADETGLELVDAARLVEQLMDFPLETLHAWVEPAEAGASE